LRQRQHYHLPNSSQSARTSSIKCFKCLVSGHITSNCSTKRTMILNPKGEVENEHSSSLPPKVLLPILLLFQLRKRVNPMKVLCYGRAIKMGWNPLEPTRPTMGSGRVGLKFFSKFQYGFIFDPIHLEPGSPGLNPWWAGLAHQFANKGSQSVFC